MLRISRSKRISIVEGHRSFSEMGRRCSLLSATFAEQVRMMTETDARRVLDSVAFLKARRRQQVREAGCQRIRSLRCGLRKALQPRRVACVCAQHLRLPSREQTRFSGTPRPSGPGLGARSARLATVTLFCDPKRLS